MKNFIKIIFAAIALFCGNGAMAQGFGFGPPRNVYPGGFRQPPPVMQRDGLIDPNRYAMGMMAQQRVYGQRMIAYQHWQAEQMRSGEWHQPRSGYYGVPQPRYVQPRYYAAPVPEQPPHLEMKAEGWAFVGYGGVPMFRYDYVGHSDAYGNVFIYVPRYNCSVVMDGVHYHAWFNKLLSPDPALVDQAVAEFVQLEAEQGIGPAGQAAQYIEEGE